MSIKPKLWGSTETVVEHPLNTAHRIEVNPRGYCSWHYHAYKWNVFVGITGRLLIHMHREDSAVIRVLDPGVVVAVPPNVHHRFVNESHGVSAVAIEYYFPEQLGEDINRYDLGGAEWSGRDYGS